MLIIVSVQETNGDNLEGVGMLFDLLTNNVGKSNKYKHHTYLITK